MKLNSNRVKDNLTSFQNRGEDKYMKHGKDQKSEWHYDS